MKQESGASSSTSCIGASSAHLQHQRVEGGFGFVEIDKPDNGGTASSISSSSFNTQKFYEPEYITKYGSEEQKENQK